MQPVSNRLVRPRTVDGEKNMQWELSAGNHFQKYQLQFAPDNSWLMAPITDTNTSPRGKHIAFFGLKTGKVINDWQKEPALHYGQEFDFTISPKGRYVVIRNGTNALRFWNVRNHADMVLQWDLQGVNYYGQFVSRPETQLLGNRLFFSPDESKIVMIDSDQQVRDTIRLIDIPTRTVREIKRPSVISSPQFQWTPDGNSIAWIDGVSGKMGRLKLTDFKTTVPVQVLAGAPPQP